MLDNNILPVTYLLHILIGLYRYNYDDDLMMFSCKMAGFTDSCGNVVAVDNNIVPVCYLLIINYVFQFVYFDIWWRPNEV